MKQYDAEIDAHNATKERLTAAKQRAEALLARIADLERWNTRQKMICDASEKRVEALREALTEACDGWEGEARSSNSRRGLSVLAVNISSRIGACRAVINTTPAEEKPR